MTADTGQVTEDNLGERIFEEAKNAFGARFSTVKTFVKAESEKLAITLRMIIEGTESGDISRNEAKILLNQQKIAASAILTSAEGMTAAAAQAAINAALKAVKDFINGKIGFALL